MRKAKSSVKECLPTEKNGVDSFVRTSTWKLKMSGSFSRELEQ